MVLNAAFATDENVAQNLQDIMADIEDAITLSKSTSNERWQPNMGGVERHTVLRECGPYPRPRSAPAISSSTGNARAKPLERLDYSFHSRRVGSYSYAEVAEIIRLLEICSIPGAAKVPRTYIVLRRMQRSDMFERIVAAGISDNQFPASADGLPNSLSLD
ncbi:hypothetical protein P171DRAFT_442089 [Karstenula rhodostoma CBS 690.94]|uniref:Uncharacterized protein n=1 Tax=Karstenula rhodostoma CBS 690.94 TaxID=1392251 RepID=A0A9P4PPZ6_9PLEO|nr:hypothetical protein P171DRAFT_442089 [Karstenula rhodostoma CBS 690.94]